MSSSELSPATIGLKGLAVAVAILGAWGGSLWLALRWPGFDPLSPQAWFIALPWMLLQMHLFTGVFITAHDAMHGVVIPRCPRLNHAIGWLCATAFVFNRYDVLLPKHHLHHRHSATAQDPDYHKGNPSFWRWYLNFALEYIRWPQILLAAILFNIFHHVLHIPVQNLLILWALPSFLSTLQLFYFGTYSPHCGEHSADNIHRARSQAPNHVWAFVSCYFFGYHYEHHDSPATPWWRLWRLR